MPPWVEMVVRMVLMVLIPHSSFANVGWLEEAQELADCWRAPPVRPTYLATCSVEVALHFAARLARGGVAWSLVDGWVVGAAMQRCSKMKTAWKLAA